MQEITKRIRDHALKDFGPAIEQMAAEGMNQDQIVRAFRSHCDSKIKSFYRKKDFDHVLKGLSLSDLKADSKAEAMFYSALTDSKIKFVFQKEIGPYRVDYVFDDTVVVELDGPQHTKAKDDRKDKYLRRMGYKVIRIPLWILAMDVGAVIDEIRGVTGGNRA